jgi:amino acid adenylation domain-containing protein
MKKNNIEDIYQLSPTQQGMLFHTLYAPSEGVYCQQFSCTFTGKLDVEAFSAAWQQVVARHVVLRTAFIWERQDQPLQVVYRQVKLPLEIYSWTGVSGDEQQQQLQAFLESDRHRGFQLGNAPLMRLTLIQMSDNVYQFAWSYHHILLDGWSLPLVFKEVLGCYEALSVGQQLQLSPTRSYREYIAWLHKQNLEVAKEFWRQTLQGVTAPTPLVVDAHQSKSLQQSSSTYSEEILTLSSAATTALVSFARRHQLTLNTLVQAAWAILLLRYSGETDVVFGVTVSGRTGAITGVESIVGLFINTLPMRVTLSSSDTVLAILKQIHKQQVEISTYEYTPLVQIQQMTDVPPGLPLFESIVVFENYPVDSTLQQNEKKLHISDVRTFERNNYPLTLIAQPGVQLSLRFIYDTQRFDSAAIARMADHFQTLLEGIITNPDQQLSEIPLLTAAEQNQILVEWNKTHADYPKQLCIHDLFEQQVQKTSDAVAVVFEDKQLTYRELNTKANQLAHHLQKLGVGPEVLVGLCVERSLDMVVGLLGILKVGGAYMPLDPAYPCDRLAYMLEDASVPVLLTQERLVVTLPEHKAKVVCLDADWQEIAQQSESNFQSKVTPEHLAYVIYTSGSTGKPKGVQILHGALVNFLNAMHLTVGLSQRDILLSVTTLSFDIAALELYLPLIVGASLVVVSREVATDGTELLKRFSSSGATIIQATPATWQLLLASGWQDSRQLKILCGGEALKCELASQLLERCTELWNLYGPTETTIWSAAHKVETLNSASCADGIVSIGRPIANTQFYILDKHEKPVPVGVPGELHIGGVSLARGYLNRPELTSEKFIHNPFSNKAGERLYKTGDLVRYRQDGNLEYLGRINEQVKIRGFRIELGEVEAVLSQHPNVRETVVTVRVDVSQDNCLVAYLVVKQQPSPTISDLRHYLKQKLPEYMVPTAFVFLDTMPLTPHGKIDRRALPAPDTSSFSRSNFVGPRNPIEEILAVIWTRVLGTEHIGIHDNFFDLGGHSLLATQVISRMRQAFGVEIGLQLLFETPTIADLASAIAVKRALCAITYDGAQPIASLSNAYAFSENEGTEELKTIPRIANRDSAPLSFAQQRLWFLEQLESNSAAYHIPLLLRLQGHLKVDVLQQSLDAIVAHHEILRTNLIASDRTNVQVIREPRPVELKLIDLQTYPETEQHNVLQHHLHQEVQRHFNLVEDLMLRGCLLQLSAQEHILLLVMHHIASDSWSIKILAEQLTNLYQLFTNNLPNPLPELPIQYADYAVWQRQWFSGQILENQLQYWKQQLKGASPVLELPTDRPRPLVQSYRGARYDFLIPQSLSQALSALSRQEGVTLFMTLLAAFEILLYRYSGQDDILIGSPIAGRNRVEIEGLIGFFVNTLVLRADLSGNPSFRELLQRVRSVALSAYTHQDLPFEKLVEELQPERSLSYHPLFQVMFVFENLSAQTFELPGLSITPMDVNAVTSKFDLSLSLTHTEQGLGGTWEYSTDLFDAGTISRMSSHFQILLAGLGDNPQQRICQLPLLTDAEKQQILVKWNNTQKEYPDDKCIHQLFEEQVEQTPDAVAVVYEDQKLTYRELNARANKLAHHLQNLGVRPEMLIGISMERSVELVVGLVAILKAGGAYVPLDPTYPKERLRLMLEDAQLQLLLTQQHLLEQLPSDGRKVVCIDSDWEATARENAANLACQLKAGDLAYVIYTSGSTGKPKGVAVPHQAISRLLFNTNYINIQSCDRVAQVSNISFDAATFEIWGALVHGAQLIGITKDIVLSPDEFVTKLQQQEISTIFLTTALFNQLANVVPDAFKNVRHLLFGGEAVDPSSVKAVLKNGSPQRLLHVYGPTECTTFSTWYLIQDAQGATIPIGRPIANTQTYILDRYLQPVPIGVVGELYIGSSGLAKGYLNRPELTAERFIPNPFSREHQARLYKTGDLVRYLPDGNIEFVGRIDNQVKIRGFRIELGEIEAVLSQHPAIQYAVVILRQDTPDDKRLVAYVVPNQNQATTVSNLRHFLKQKLPNYMIPAAFVILEALPLTPNGKVDRQALPAPEKVTQELEATFVDPRNELERQLTEIWEDILTVKPISVRDNFFDLGGHSLLAVSLFAQIKQKFGKKLPLASLFTSGTVEALAQMLSIQEKMPENLVLAASHQEKQDICLCLVPIQPLGSKPPFFCIHPAGGDVLCYRDLAMHLGAEQPFYGLQSLGLDGTQPPLTRIEDMAALYIKEIQTIQPNGPYFLGGFSLGGVIAYEMAQQLRRQGQEVRLIAMLDSSVPGSAKRSPFPKRIFIHIKNIFQFGPDYLSKKLVSWSKWGKSYITEIYTSFLGRTQPLTESDNYMFIVNKQAWETYTFQPYPGRIILFRADDNSRDTQEAFVGFQTDPLLGWGNLITGEIELHNIPCGHSTILGEPHVSVVVEKLKDCLEKAYRTL